MPRLNPRLEIVRFDPRCDPQTGYRVVQVAVDGQLAVPMDIHEDDIGSMGAQAFENKLLRDGQTLIRQYGDCRKVKYREDGSYISLGGE